MRTNSINPFTTKTYFLLTLYILLAHLVTAQNSLIGVLKSETGEPVEYANVVLYQQNEVVEGVFSEVNGAFEIKDIAVDSYRLEISYVGYENIDTLINITEGINDLGIFSFGNEGQMLEGVVVTEFKNQMKSGVDKKTVNISEGMKKSNNNVSELFEKIALIQMDFEGNPSLAGRTGVVVLVDGRPPRIRANDVATVLRSLPSDNIERIEILSNPPAKYRSGNKAVINIVTTDAPQKGVLANFWSNYNSLHAKSIGGNFTIKNGKFSLSSWGGIWQWRNKRERSSERENLLSEENRFFNSKDEYTRNNQGFYFGISPEYEFNEHNTLSFFVGGYRYSGESENLTNASIQDFTQMLVDQYQILGNNSWEGGENYTGLQYFKTFKNSDAELEFELESNFQQIDRGDDLSTQTTNNTTTVRKMQNRTKNAVISPGYSSALNFFLPLDSTSNLNFNVAYNYDGKNENKIRLYDGISRGQLVENSRFSTDEITETDDFTGSISFQKSIKKSTLKLDLGYTREHVKATFNNSQIVDRNFEYWTPTLSFSQKIKEHELGLSYKFSSESPESYNFNPIESPSVDGFSVRTGNPNLDLERKHRVEFSHSFFKGAFNYGTVLFYENSDNQIGNVSQVNDAGVRLTTYENIGTQQDVGVEFSLSGAIKKKYRINLSTSIYDSKVQNQNVESKTFTYSGKVNVSAPIFAGVTSTLVVNVNGPSIVFQQEIDPYQTVSLNFRKSILKNKINLTLYFSDLFRSDIQNTTFIDDTFRSVDRRQRLRPYAGLRMNMRFGKLKELPKSSASMKMG